MAARIIEADRSIIVAADVEPQNFERLVHAVGHVEGLSGYKIGFEVGLGLGLREATDIVRSYGPELRVIYDHQKAATDTPYTGKDFARTMLRGAVDAAILFPFTGPDVEERWIQEHQ